MAPIKTLIFENSPSGQKKKTNRLNVELALGWEIVSETIDPGKYNTDQACCAYLMCGPIGILMGGHKKGSINVTLKKESEKNINYSQLVSALENFNNFELTILQKEIPENAVLIRDFGNTRSRTINSKPMASFFEDFPQWCMTAYFILYKAIFYQSAKLVQGDVNAIRLIYLIMGMLACPFFARFYEKIMGKKLNLVATWAIILFLWGFICIMEPSKNSDKHNMDSFDAGKKDAKDLLNHEKKKR